VFDPVHGVFHHFYQIHLAYGAGHGPDYGHFVSKVRARRCPRCPSCTHCPSLHTHWPRPLRKLMWLHTAWLHDFASFRTSSTGRRCRWPSGTGSIPPPARGP
jgi:hypothetical protein